MCGLTSWVCEAHGKRVVWFTMVWPMTGFPDNFSELFASGDEQLNLFALRLGVRTLIPILTRAHI